MRKKYSILLEDIQQKNALRTFYLKNKLYKKVSVDIIMPVYNRQETIEKSIESVLNQSHLNWNLYIWDDGSTDNTRSHCKKYESNLKIHYYHSAENNGVSYARNQCLKYSKSEIIAYLDSDNEWHPDYLLMICSFMSKFKLKCAYLGFKYVDENGTQGCLGQDFSWDECLKQNYIDLNCFAHTQEQLKISNSHWHYNFDESIDRLVDWDFILRITKNVRCKFLRLFLVNYYCGSKVSRITNTVYKNKEELIRIIQFIQNKHKTD